MIYVYAIKSTTFNRIYVGMSEDVENRLAEHNSGKHNLQDFTAHGHCFIMSRLKLDWRREKEKFISNLVPAKSF
jgi:predicted GIY-YIG superfamily endonuclease